MTCYRRRYQLSAIRRAAGPVSTGVHAAGVLGVFTGISSCSPREARGLAHDACAAKCTGLGRESWQINPRRFGPKCLNERNPFAVICSTRDVQAWLRFGGKIREQATSFYTGAWGLAALPLGFTPALMIRSRNRPSYAPASTMSPLNRRGFTPRPLRGRPSRGPDFVIAPLCRGLHPRLDDAAAHAAWRSCYGR